MANKEKVLAADKALGETVNTLIFRTRSTRRELAEKLNVVPPVMGRKLRGEIGWSLQDLYLTAAFFNLNPGSLLPVATDDDMTQYQPALDALLASIPSPSTGKASQKYTAGDLNPEPAGSGCRSTGRVR